VNGGDNYNRPKVWRML